MTYQWPKPRRLHFLVAACGSLGFSQGSGSLAFQLLGLLSLLLPLGQDLGVLSGSQPNFTKAWVSKNQTKIVHKIRLSPVLLTTTTLECEPVSLPLQHDGGHKPLDLRSRELLLLTLLNSNSH